MKAKVGKALIALGLVLLIAALGLFLYNRHMQNKAEDSVEGIIPILAEKINENVESSSDVLFDTDDGITADPIEHKKMETVEIDGNFYIGVISIPTLSIELPVMADWSREKLNVSPCRYYGDVFSDNMVIMAHNYLKHFAPLSQLSEMDMVRFTDVNGNVTEYRVSAVDILSAYAVEEMTAGEYDLTLFTCNYDGKSRVTVRCDKE